MKRKRIICLVLTLCVFLSLAACGGKVEEHSNAPAPAQQSAEIAADGQWHGKGGCYKLDKLSEGSYSMIKGSAEHLIFRSDLHDRLYSEDGSLLYDGYANDYAVVEDGVWCVRATGMVDGNYIEACYAVKLGFDGQELVRFDVSGRAERLAVVDGNLYIFDPIAKTLTLYSVEGAELGQFDLSSAQLEDFSGSLCTGGDGRVWLISNLASGTMLYPVNLSSMDLGPAYELPEDTIALRTGTAEHCFLLTTQKELSYLDPATGSAENILYWDECGLSGEELGSFIPDGDGFLCLSVTGLSRLRPAQPEEIRPRTLLTLGAVMEYDGHELAARFNAMSNDYRVEVVDYSSGGQLSPEEAQMKLNTELMSGGGPDMVLSAGLSSSQGASVYADMYPLLDADPEVKREDFYALKALENGGKLTLAPATLYISTFGALPELAEGRSGWTWDEYFEVESKLPPDGVMSSYLGADFFLRNSLELYAPHAIDWVTGKCSFDTPEFVRILQAAKDGYDPNCPAENPYFIGEVNAMMADGRMILSGAGFVDVETFAQNELMNGRELDYIGWPTPDGSCGSVFHVSGVYINASSSYMDGCWEFAKYVLKNSYAYKPTFEKAIAEATASKDAASGGARVTLTQSQAERYKVLMESITVAVSDNSELSDIVLKEAAAMFAGNMTPEETAKLIQSKISIYVAEHM